MFEQKYEKCMRLLSENFQFLEVKFSTYLHRRVLVMMTDAILRKKVLMSYANSVRIIAVLLRKYAYSNIENFTTKKEIKKKSDKKF